MRKIFWLLFLFPLMLSCATPTMPGFMKDPAAKILKPGVIVHDVVWAGATYRVISVDTRKAELKMLSHVSTEGAIHNFKTLSVGRNLIFAVNGGMFHKDLQPVGLYIENGRIVAPLNLRPGAGNFFLKPNGVFALTKSGPQIIVSENWRGSADFATQSGPMLVVNGALHPSFIKDSTNLNIRSGVGVTGQRFVHLAISLTPVKLYDFAEFYKNIVGASSALYLDGHISQAFIPGLSNPFPQEDFGTFIFVE